MSFPTMELQIQRFANALYNVQLGSDTMDSVLAGTPSFTELNNTFNYVYQVSFGTMSTAQVTETLLANLGIVSGQNGLDDATVAAVRSYVEGVLNATPASTRGTVVSQLTSVWASLGDDPLFGNAVDAWNAEIEEALAWEASQEGDAIAGTDVPVQSIFSLTTGFDGTQVNPFNGSAGSDIFYADVVQEGGPQVNTLGTGDVLRGLGGADILDAQITNGLYMGSGNMPIMPDTQGIETVKLEAIFSSISSGDLFRSQAFDGDNVYFSAKNMRGVDFIGSDHSDADLVIQDLTVDEGELTSSMTIGMAYTGNADSDWDASDLTVLFDEDDLLAGRSQSATAKWWVINEVAWDVIEDGLAITPDPALVLDASDPDNGTTYATLEDDEFLFRNDRQGVIFTLDGVEYFVTIGGDGAYVTHDYKSDLTYEDFVASLNAELAAMIADPSGRDGTNANLAGLSFVLDYNDLRFTQTDTPGNIASMPAIVLTGVQDDRQFSNLGFIRDLGATGYFDMFGDVRDRSDVEDLLISVDVDLEKVGRGGAGGDLIIGGMNKDVDGDGDINEWGDGSPLKPAGVQQFNVNVIGNALLPNSLASLSSTNNALEVVNIAGAGALQRVNGADVTTYASLQIGNSNTPGVLGTLAGNANALQDVKTLDASTFNGDLTVFAALTDEIVPKYLTLSDDQQDRAADNDQFVYTLGNGDDYLNLVITNSTTFFTGSTTREDFQLDINGGAGDDTIVTLIGDGTGTDLTEWYINSHWNNTNPYWWEGNPQAYLVIDAGDGDDFVWTKGAGDFIINAGDGNDTVFTDNFTGTKAQWTLNYRTGSTTVGEGNDLGTNPVLVNGNLPLNTTYDLTAVVTFNDLVATATFSFPAAAGGGAPRVSDHELNQLVKAAINNDDVLSQLLVARDGVASTLIIDALVTGDQAIDNYLPQPAAVPFSTQTVGELSISFLTEDGADAGTALDPWSPPFYRLQQTAAGSDDSASSDNIINLGSDNDLLVLSQAASTVAITFTETVTVGTDTTPVTQTASFATSDAESNDTIVYDALDFGDDTILNFVPSPLATLSVGNDVLDFTALLDGTVVADLGSVSVLIQNGYDGTDNSVMIWDETIANDTAGEIKTLFDATAAEDLTVSNHLYVAVDADNIGSVYLIEDGAVLFDSVVTLLGTIDLADTDWFSLGINNFA